MSPSEKFDPIGHLTRQLDEAVKIYLALHRLFGSCEYRPLAGLQPTNAQIIRMRPLDLERIAAISVCHWYQPNYRCPTCQATAEAYEKCAELADQIRALNRV